LLFISSCSFREAPLADHHANQTETPLLGGVIWENVARTENRWLAIMAGMLAFMMAVVVVTSIADALHPPSNVETVDPITLHLGGEFAESNLGTAIEPDGSATVRLIAQEYAFVPDCVQVPADTPVKIRLTSTDVIHGFLLPDTNVNTMVVPGWVAEVRTNFSRPGVYVMPCNEFCGVGHHGMWARVVVLPKEQFAKLAALERASCAKQ
jgi:cytochrome c oxidase subunit II